MYIYIYMYIICIYIIMYIYICNRYLQLRFLKYLKWPLISRTKGIDPQVTRPRKLTWPWKTTVIIGKSAVKGPCSIVVLNYRRVYGLIWYSICSLGA